MWYEIPGALRLGDVILDYICGDVADAAEEFSWAPKMPFAEMSSQPKMLSEKFIGRDSFKQLQRF